MVKANISKLGNPEDARTITLSVQMFLELDLADTQDNTRKIKQIKKEEAKLCSPLYGLVQRIKPLLTCVKSNPPNSFLALPAPRQHGASMWRFICRPFTTCFPKQRISDSGSNASITSATKLCSPTFESLSSGNEPVRPHDLQNDPKLTMCCRKKNGTDMRSYPS